MALRPAECHTNLGHCFAAWLTMPILIARTGRAATEVCRRPGLGVDDSFDLTALSTRRSLARPSEHELSATDRLAPKPCAHRSVTSFSFI